MRDESSGAAQQPRARSAQPVLHAAVRRPVPRRQHARPHVVADARRRHAASPRSANSSCLDNADELTRQKKDPRDITILDPACGSGHFLLYAFDLLQTIYEEAWHDDASPPSAGDRLDADARTTLNSERLRRALPGADPRAQPLRRRDRPALRHKSRRWRSGSARSARIGSTEIPAAERPRITRTHIVVAEPMPGDGALVETFAERPPAPFARRPVHDGWSPRCASPASSGRSCESTMPSRRP